MPITATRFIHRRRLHAAFGATLIVAALAVTLTAPGAALATTLPYDKTNPISTGCANSAYTVGTNNLFTSRGQIVGRVELRYSTACRTNWSRVVSYVGARNLLAFAYRPRDGQSTWGWGGDPGPFFGTTAYSDQVYGYNTVVSAYGAIYGLTEWFAYCG